MHACSKRGESCRHIDKAKQQTDARLVMQRGGGSDLVSICHEVQPPLTERLEHRESPLSMTHRGDHREVLGPDLCEVVDPGKVIRVAHCSSPAEKAITILQTSNQHTKTLDQSSMA